MAAYLVFLKTEPVDPLSAPRVSSNGKAFTVVTDPRYVVTDLDLATTAKGEQAAGGSNSESQNLFEKFHCAACHNAPDTKESDPAKMSLRHVAEKFQPGKLAEFLRQPEADYADLYNRCRARWARRRNEIESEIRQRHQQASRGTEETLNDWE